MNAALAATAVLMGLAGAPHCAAMCGAACGAVVRGCSGASVQRGMLAFHCGRALSYALGGAVVAGGVSWLAVLGNHAAAVRPLWGMLHVAALVLGLWLLVRGRQPTWIEALGQRLGRAPTGHHVVWMKGPMAAAAAGGLWIAWPCGLLQSALVVAALGSSAADGALLMALFAAGSAVGLWLGPSLWLRLAGNAATTAQTLAVRLAGLVLASASGWALFHGLAAYAQSDLCLLPAGR
jgi:sulfite exporter TauE/SafE